MNSHFDVVVVGSANIDQTICLDSLPKAGQTVFGKELIITEGGKGANQAVASSRLGAKTAFIGCIGNDQEGQRIKKCLESEKVNCEKLFLKSSVPTGRAFILLDANGTNMITVLPGANDQISLSDINDSASLIQNAAVLLLQHEVPQDVIEYSAELAHEFGVKIILNPAPARKVSPCLLSKLYCIIPNDIESEIITGISSQSENSLFLQSQWFHKNNVPLVIITCGERGAFVSTHSKSYLQPARKVSAIDTVGAGDCFCGAFAAAIAKNYDVPSAVEFAIFAASVSVTRKGALASMPHIHELKNIIDDKQIFQI